MEATLYSNSQYSIIALKGDLNATSSLLLDQVLHRVVTNSPCPRQLLINCKDLRHISSAGIGAFVAYLKEMEIHKIKLVFYGLNTVIRDRIRASRLEIPSATSLEFNPEMETESEHQRGV